MCVCVLLCCVKFAFSCIATGVFNLHTYVHGTYVRRRRQRRREDLDGKGKADPAHEVNLQGTMTTRSKSTQGDKPGPSWRHLGAMLEHLGTMLEHLAAMLGHLCENRKNINFLTVFFTDVIKPSVGLC